MSGYDSPDMVALRLVLQLPAADLRSVRLVSATDDQEAISAFAERQLLLAHESIDAAADPFSRELAYLEMEQLRARLKYALSLDGIPLRIGDRDGGGA